LLEQERKNTCELKRLLKLEKDKNEELAQEHVIGKETISSLEGSIGALHDSYDVLQRTHKDLTVQFDAFWASIPKSSSTPDTTKVSTSNGYIRCYNVDIDALYAKSQQQNVEKIVVESCDEAIGKENDALKLEVKRLKQKVRVLEKQVKAQPSQDNRRNMVNKLEKGKLCPCLLLNNKRRVFITRKKKEQTLMRKLSMHGVSS
jgi:hypothetical protein